MAMVKSKWMLFYIPVILIDTRHFKINIKGLSFGEEDYHPGLKTTIKWTKVTVSKHFNFLSKAPNVG